MDLRLQAHEIIRTWLFSTVVRSHLEFDSLPFTNALISGWILDPNRKKMSKSKGNVVTPQPLIDQHGADAVRYWAASGRPGTDTAIDEGQMKIGRRLTIKMLNASKFVLGRLDAEESLSARDVTMPLDLDVLALLGALVSEATKSFEGYDYARVLERAESFFWSFCDNYVELVKTRAYGEGDAAATKSARATLEIALSVLQRLFAPILPFVTEEVWSWWHEDSVHLASWPTLDELGAPIEHAGSTYQPVCDVLEAIRREKSTAKVSQRAAVARLLVSAPEEFAEALRASSADLIAAGNIEEFVVTDGNESDHRGHPRRDLRQDEIGSGLAHDDTVARDLVEGELLEGEGEGSRALASHVHQRHAELVGPLAARIVSSRLEVLNVARTEQRSQIAATTVVLVGRENLRKGIVRGHHEQGSEFVDRVERVAPLVS